MQIIFRKHHCISGQTHPNSTPLRRLRLSYVTFYSYNFYSPNFSWTEKYSLPTVRMESCSCFHLTDSSSGSKDFLKKWLG